MAFVCETGDIFSYPVNKNTTGYGVAINDQEAVVTYDNEDCVTQIERVAIPAKAQPTTFEKLNWTIQIGIRWAAAAAGISLPLANS